MKVSKNSWHYKWNRKLRGTYETEDKDTLCSYFWYTFFNILFPLAALFTVIVLVSMTGASLLEESGVTLWLSPVVGLLFFTALFGFLFGVSYLVAAVLRKTKTKLEERKPSLLGSYLKAKKEKICPFIDFE